MNLGYAIAEEVFYRGWIQARLAGVFGQTRGGTVLSVVVAAVVFTGQHMTPLTGALAWGYSGLILFGGVAFGWIFSRYGLLAAIIVHFAADVMLTWLPLLNR